MFRHGSLRDDRRRRSLVEDSSTDLDSSPPAKTRSRSTKSAETYTDLARTENHARWSDYVPRRNWTLATLLVVGMSVIAGLEVSYYFAARSTLWSSGSLGALDLESTNSIAGWLAALTLFSSAVISLLIYSVRRYRTDDYRGRYRVWLWAAVVWVVMSIDVVADLRSAIIALCISLSGWTGPMEGLTWWLAPWSLVLLYIGLRMLFDVRACRSATVSMLVAGGGLTATFVLPQVPLRIESTQMTMLTAGCSLVATWLLFFANTAFARHVLLDAHGQLPLRVPKPKREKAKPEPAGDNKPKSVSTSPSVATKDRNDLTTRVDPPHTSSFRPATSGIDLKSRSPQAASTAARPSPQFIGGYDDDHHSGHSNKLSRAERKRLRKQQRAGRDEDE
jgi:hypothetical protein